MNELVVQLAAKAGLNEVLANEILAKKAALAKKAQAKKALTKKAVGKKTAAIILGSLRNEGAADEVQALIDKIPDAEAAIETRGGGGGFVGLSGGSLIGRRGRPIGPGLSMGQIQGIAYELFKFGRDRAGAERMGVIIAGTSGFRQFA